MLGRAQNKVDAGQSERLRQLAVDPSPAVRQQILCRVNVLYLADPNLMWELCETAFSSEKNPNVLTFLLSAVGNVMHARPDWVADNLKALFISRRTSPENGRELGHAFVSLVMSLFLWEGNTTSGDLVFSWCDNPVENHALVSGVIVTMRGALVAGDPLSPTEREDNVRARAQEILRRVVVSCLEIYDRIIQLSDLDQETRGQAEVTVQLLDIITRELYHGSGAFAASNPLHANQAMIVSNPAKFARFLEETLHSRPFGSMRSSITIDVGSSTSHPRIRKI